MLLLLAVISFIAIIVGIIIYAKSYDYREVGKTIAGWGAVILVVAVLFIMLGGHQLATAHTIDEKIALYEQENRIIEEKIELSVSRYLEHERETLANLTPENAANFVAFIPELNSDSVVQQQIATYLENHEAIVRLKLHKINLATSRWFIYFGS